MLYWCINLSISIIAGIVSLFFVKWYFSLLTVVCTSAALSLFFILLIILIGILTPMLNYKKPSKFSNFLITEGYGYLSAMAGIHCKFIGKEKLPKDTPFLLVSNHISNFDNMITSYVLRSKKIVWISKKENFKLPVARHYMKRACYLCLDRGNLKAGLDIMTRAGEVMKNKIASVGVYPEGKRGDGIAMRPFKAGCFKSVLWGQCPLVICSIKGTENIKKHFPFRPTKVTLEILDVLPYEQIKDKSTIELAEYSQKIVQQSLDSKD